MDQRPILGESIALVHLAPQKLEILAVTGPMHLILKTIFQKGGGDHTSFYHLNLFNASSSFLVKGERGGCYIMQISNQICTCILWFIVHTCMYQVNINMKEGARQNIYSWGLSSFLPLTVLWSNGRKPLIVVCFKINAHIR